MTQRSLDGFFRQGSSDINPRTQESTPERPTITPITPTRTTPVTVNDVPLPQAIIKVINGLASKYAAMFCTSLNNTERINSLQQHKTEGTIPPQMEFKFKKLFTRENETNLRSTMINAAIDQELSNLQTKQMELNNVFNSRLQDLEQTISNPLNMCSIQITSDQIIATFNNTLQERKLEFILKRNRDQEIKQAKRERFLARREADNEIATLSTRQVNKLQKEIKDLKSSLQKVSISNSKKPKSKPKPTSDRSKNVQGGLARSTGKKRKRNGKKNSTSRNN
jgi:hypothetical protein